MAMHRVFGAADPSRDYTQEHSVYALLLNAQGCLALREMQLLGCLQTRSAEAELLLLAHLQQQYQLDARILWHLAETETYLDTADGQGFLQFSSFYLAELERPAAFSQALQWLTPATALSQLPEGRHRWVIEHFSPYLIP